MKRQKKLSAIGIQLSAFSYPRSTALLRNEKELSFNRMEGFLLFLHLLIADC